MTDRYVSSDLLFQAQNAAIELAKKLGAAEERIKFLEFELKKPHSPDTFNELRHGSFKVIERPRQPGKSYFNHLAIIRELYEMVRGLTAAADKEGRGWAHPTLEYVKQCRERIKGLL